MKPKVDINDEFDVAVLNFIKTVYYQSKYDKESISPRCYRGCNESYR